MGSSLAQFAFVWWLTEETGSAGVLSLASMAALLPEMVMQPFAGAIVDRNDRKLFIILNDAIIALATLVVGLLFYFGKIAVWHIYIMMAVRAVASAFHYPASQATVALMVSPEHLTRISGLNQALQGIVRIVAPALGALILSVAGVEGAVLIDVITSLMAIGIVFYLAIPKQPQLNKKDGHWFKIILSDMREGFQYLLRWKGLMGLTAMALIVKIALTPAFSLISLLVQNHFGGGAAEFSRIEMSIGVGVIAGSLLLGIWGGFRKHMGTIICGIAGMGVGMLLLGVLPSQQFLPALAAALLLGFMIPIVDARLWQSCRQKYIMSFRVAY